MADDLSRRPPLEMDGPAGAAAPGDPRLSEILAHALGDTLPNDVPLLERLADRMHEAGHRKEELRIWKQVLRFDRLHRQAHMRLAALFEVKGRADKVVHHLQAVVGPDDVGARGRIAAGLCQLGRFAEAAPHFRAVAEAPGGTIRDWKRLGRCLIEIDDFKGAAEAWRTVLGLEPADLEAIDRLEQLDGRAAQATGARRAGRPAPALRISVLGNCQAFGLSQCLRHLCPEADISSMMWTEAGTAMSDEQIARRLEGRDLVISQPGEKPYHGALRTSVLAPRMASYVLFPNVLFTGFHPDLMQLNGSLSRVAQRHRFGVWHSALAMGAFLRGVPESQAADLFNAYIYDALGYFDEYAKAEQHLLQAGRESGMDLEPELATWRRNGIFVHVPNHPTVGVFWSLAELICRRLGLETRTIDTLPPDRLATYNSWPVYPEIARRLQVEGSLRFQSCDVDEPPREVDALIHELYRVYAQTDPEALRVPRIIEVEEILKREGV